MLANKGLIALCVADLVGSTTAEAPRSIALHPAFAAIPPVILS